MERILFFDTESTGFPSNKVPYHSTKQAAILQIAASIITDTGDVIEQYETLTKIGPRSVNPMAQKVHGISAAKANNEGVDQHVAYSKFHSMVMSCDALCGHNINFDIKMLHCMAFQSEKAFDEADEAELMLGEILDLPHYCTMAGAKEYCGLKNKRGALKAPKLDELHQHLFNELPPKSHDAFADVETTARCFYELRKLQVM